MNAEVILSCLVGFIGGFVFAILIAIGVVKKLVTISGKVIVKEEE